MVVVRPMVGQDRELLMALFPEKPEEQFESRYYLEHLQERRIVLVAGAKVKDETEDEAETKMRWELYGYGCILWESPYTHFWRRRVPEIVDLNVAEPFRQRGIATAIIAKCEQICRERGYEQLGISVEQSADYAAANRLYPKLGYVPDGFGISQHDNELHLVKSLVEK